MRALTNDERAIVRKALRHSMAWGICNALLDAAVELDLYSSLAALETKFKAATAPNTPNSSWWFGLTSDERNVQRRKRALRSMLITDTAKRNAALKKIKAENRATLKREAAE